MSRPRLLHPLRLCAVLALATPLLALADPRYTVTEIAGADSYARGINNLGEVVGTMAAADTYHAFVYAGGSLADLGSFGGSATAYAINDAGQVVGTAFSTSSDTPTRGFLYSGGTMNTIGAGSGNTWAYGINNAGTVVGTMSIDDPESFNITHAYTYAGGSFADLGTLPTGDSSRAFAINNAGDVVGAAASAIQGAPNFPEDPFLYRGGVMTSLGNLGGIWSGATAINDLGQIVGFIGTAYLGGEEIYPQSAFLYENGVLHNLGGLAPNLNSSARDINNLGQIVGSARIGDGSGHAFLYENGAMIDLNMLIDPASGWTILDAAAINELQQIAATACRGDVCQAVRLDLVPSVPEPSAYALLVAGLAFGFGGGLRRPAGRRRG